MEQMAPIISENPFMKNDQKHLEKIKSLLPSFVALTDKEVVDERKEETEIVEREHFVSEQRDLLKQELDLVLEGIRKMGGVTGAREGDDY